MLTPEELKELREAYERSTQGEWDYQPADCDCDDMEAKETDPKHQCGPADLSLPEVQTAFGYTRRPSLFQVDCGDFMGLKNEDARFIALSHNVMPALLQAAEENAALKEKLERFALDALSALSTFTVTPVEGYLRAPHVLVLDIARLGKERDTLQQQLAEYRARVAELEEALEAAEPYVQRFAMNCTIERVSKALSRAEAKGKQ